MKKIFIFLVFLVVFVFSVQSQTITGVVTEMIGNNKEPIMGVNVVVVNSTSRYLKGTVTNLNGVYTLDIPKDLITDISLRFSYIGMETKTVKYNGQKILNVTLSTASTTTIKEVQVVGTRTDRDGFGVSKLEQTAATQKIQMSEIVEHEPVSSIEEALQGRLTGVDIAVSGDPGSKSSIRIRGTSSLTSNDEPLIVVDGVPYNTSTDNMNWATANEEDFGALLNISPATIESIEVLKDASATAVYGTKGANGVILINTKKGTMGKTRFSFSTKFTAKFEPSSIPLLNGDQYTSLMQDAIWNAANAKGVTNASTEMYNLFHADEILFNKEYQYFNEYNQSTNWLDEIRRNAYISDNTFSMNGGGEKATYRFNLGYYKEQGTTKGTDLNRLNTSFNIVYRFSDRLKVTTDVNYTDTKKYSNYESDVRSVAQKRMPNLGPYWIDKETGLATNHYFQQQEDFQGNYINNGIYNPLAMVNESYNNTRQTETRMTLSLEYYFPFHLTYQGYVSYNIKKVKNDKFLPQEATGVLWTSNYANLSTDATSDNMVLQTENKLLYNNTFNNVHRLVATALIRTSATESNNISETTAGNISTSAIDPANGGRIVSSNSGRSQRRTVSLIGQVVYTYDDRYVARATINYEGNSSMGSSNRWGTFPAFGLAWNIHREHFFKNRIENSIGDVYWLTEMKLRASLGWSGNAPSGAYTYMGAYQSMSTYMDNSAVTAVRMQLDKLKWESTREWDIGLDLRLFNKLGFTIDYYDKKTSDLLLSNPNIPTTTGFSSIKYLNSGELSNKGIEFRVDYDVIKSKDWNLTVNANMSRNINKVESLPSTWSYENYTFGNGNYALKILENAAVGAFYGYLYNGVYQNTVDTYARDKEGNIMTNVSGNPIVMRNGSTLVFPGDAKYEDVNKDGVINEKDIVYLGTSNPKLICGAGFTLKYKQLSLTAFLYGRIGQKVINSARMELESMYGSNNQSTAVLSRWRAEGDDTDIPRALYKMGYNYLGSDRFVEDASYVRLKTVSLNYNFSKKWLKKTFLTSASVFITGYDLLTFTNYSGQDPEVSLPTATKLVKDNSTAPVTKRVSFGINLNF